MCRVQRILGVVAAICFSICGPAIADEAASNSPMMTPLEVLTDAIDAVEKGDFERYVGHLTDHEQQMQAGYVLYIVVALTESKDATAAKPEMFLLAQALRKVATNHLVIPENASVAAPGETPEMLVRRLLTSLFVRPVGPSLSDPYKYPAPSFNQVCLQAAKLVKDPKQFLIEALKELSMTIEVSGAEPDRPVESIELAAQARLFKEVKWVLYTRGDHAIAVQKLPKAKNVAASNTAAANTTQPPTDDKPTPIHIEFRKIDSQWKIERLLPVDQMQGELKVSPYGSHAVPYPASW